jgi:hypothetical protein
MVGGGVTGQRGGRGAALATGGRRAVGGAGGAEPSRKRCDDDDAQMEYQHHREEDSVARSPYHVTRDPQFRRYVLVRWEKKEVEEREGDSLAFVLPHEETDAVGSGSLTLLLAPSNRLAMNIFVLCEHKVFLSMRATPAQLNFFVIIVISLVAYIEWEHIRCN